ncbi:MAG TPA: NADH-quinone oxidoreductase subunit D [Candidatus Latescibacteria bacterium]|nr:NADH-quinone oxidoreductase subunit D [Candidatus Latescibacterota bacterium]
MPLKTEEMILNVGPQHPSTHCVLRLEVTTDGELVTSAEPTIGYLHRCFEKYAETLTYQQIIPYTDRLDYLSSMNNNFGFVVAVEKLMGIHVCERAERIRVIMAELNRIASHLMFIGSFSNDLGAMTPFLWCFRDREEILKIFEEVSGARLLYNYYRIGGLAADLTPGIEEKIHSFLNHFEAHMLELDDLFTRNAIVIARLKGVGMIPREMAIAYGLSGPMLRASGVDWDCRRDEPYSIYASLRFEVPVGGEKLGALGDCYARYLVRRAEIDQSVSLVRQCLADIPPGDVKEQVKRNVRPPVGEVYVRTENPRGEIGFYLRSDGSTKPSRVKVRAPSFCNMSVFSRISKDILVADMIAILGSVDIVLGEIDR